MSKLYTIINSSKDCRLEKPLHAAFWMYQLQMAGNGIVYSDLAVLLGGALLKTQVISHCQPQSPFEAQQMEPLLGGK